MRWQQPTPESLPSHRHTMTTPLSLRTSLQQLCAAHNPERRTVSSEALGKMEACLGSFLREMGENLGQLLEKTRQVTVSGSYVQMYAAVGLHLRPQQLEQLRHAMTRQPSKDSGRSLSKQYGLTLAMKRVVELVQLGIQERVATKANFSTDARVGCTWLAELVTLHFLRQALQGCEGKRLRGTEVAGDWLRSFVGATFSLDTGNHDLTPHAPPHTVEPGVPALPEEGLPASA
jgi:histone H3/H4